MFSVEVTIEVREQDKYGTTPHLHSRLQTLSPEDELVNTVEATAEAALQDVLRQRAIRTTEVSAS